MCLMAAGAERYPFYAKQSRQNEVGVMKCPVCGNDLADTAAFCPTCGTRVDGKGASAPVTPVAEQGGGFGLF